MFKRLLKHEIISNYKYISILCAIIVGCGIFASLAIWLESMWLLSLLIIVISLSVTAVNILLLIYIFNTIGKNTFEKRGYLTFQIPVSSHQIVLSKIVTILIAEAVIFISTIFAFYIIFIPLELAEDVAGIINNILSINILPLLFQLLCSLISLINSIIMLFFAFAICNSQSMKSNKSIMAIGLYFAFSIGISILSSFDFMNLYFSVSDNAFIFIERSLLESVLLDDSGLINIWTVIIEIVTSIGFYIGTIKLLDNRLELE